MDLRTSLAATITAIGTRPDVAASVLVDRLRAVVPGDWTRIVEHASEEVLELAAGRVASELEASAEELPGRVVEDRWMLSLLSRQLGVGYQLAAAEHNESVQRIGAIINTMLELLRHEQWIERKRLYEARRTQLESDEAVDVTHVMERRAAELELDAHDVAALRALIKACEAKGVDVAFAELPELHPNELLNRITMVGSWRETLLIVQAHPQLLSDETIALLEQTRDVGGPADQLRLEQHLEVLRRCRTVGVERAFAEAPAMGGELGLKFASTSIETDVELPADGDPVSRAGPWPRLRRASESRCCSATP